MYPKIALILTALLLVTPWTLRAVVPAVFNKEQIEADVIKKFIALQSEREEFYRISNIEIFAIEDDVLHKPGYAIQINYSTPQCKNNFFKGLSYSVDCQDDRCPFGMIYQRCY